jgi:hypothetical protein
VNILVKILLAILFFLCLLDMPFGYFQFVRLVEQLAHKRFDWQFDLRIGAQA